MVSATDKHTEKNSKDMQLDTNSLFVPKLKETLFAGRLAGEIIREIDSWNDDGKRKKAQLALEMLKGFDGNMAVDSGGAALTGALLNCATRNIFLDELGPQGSRTWSAFLVINNESYNATCDHILVRGDESPFWDDLKTQGKETKAQILARSLADAVAALESLAGNDPKKWNWGILHTSVWETEASKMTDRMGIVERLVMKALWPYFNRGPYPAPGDVFTLNVSQYTMGENFDTWLIPEMRMIVDFSKNDPMCGVNSSGQSDNPSSPHYDDGIQVWRRGDYIEFPFREEAVKAQYREALVLTP
jgi:acyl-homoserine-lactone acylase